MNFKQQEFQQVCFILKRKVWKKTKLPIVTYWGCLIFSPIMRKFFIGVAYFSQQSDISE